MRFTLRQLSYFVAVCETGSVTRAAEEVNISPPSISAAISHLEAEFGVQLFLRQHARGLSLTPAGKRLMRASKEALASARELYDIASLDRVAASGPINVGIFTTLAPVLIPCLWQSFRTKFPDVSMNVTEGSEEELLDGLRNGRIDIALTYAVHLSDDIAFTPLAQLPTYALVAATHPIARRRSVRLRDLAGEPFVLLDLPLSREYFLGLFDKAGLAPRIVAQTAYPETLRAFVVSGIGFSLMTSRPMNKAALNGQPLEYLMLDDNFPPMILGAATLRNLRKPRAVEEFERHCLECIDTGNPPGMLPFGVA